MIWPHLLQTTIMDVLYMHRQTESKLVGNVPNGRLLRCSVIHCRVVHRVRMHKARRMNLSHNFCNAIVKIQYIYRGEDSK